MLVGAQVQTTAMELNNNGRDVSVIFGDGAGAVIIRGTDKNKGILFWITGLSGSGKTTIAKKIKKDIIQLYGPTLLVSGDNLRKIFNFNKYTYNERLSLSKKFCKFNFKFFCNF